ncbi:MAG: hypothetical protein H6918_05255 [Sphingomonadaceae bacterium]|nr:hypothetical protein [Sphingomonadaceae bacterium]
MRLIDGSELAWQAFVSEMTVFSIAVREAADFAKVVSPPGLERDTRLLISDLDLVDYVELVPAAVESSR